MENGEEYLCCDNSEIKKYSRKDCLQIRNHGSILCIDHENCCTFYDNKKKYCINKCEDIYNNITDEIYCNEHI